MHTSASVGTKVCEYPTPLTFNPCKGTINWRAVCGRIARTVRREGSPAQPDFPTPIQADKQACRAFPEPKGDGTEAGVPPQSDVIEAILSHCGLWQSRSPQAPPEVHEVVLELDAAYSGNAIDAPNEADESHELTYVDIDTFLTNF